jgi:hypothetical protein
MKKHLQLGFGHRTPNGRLVQYLLISGEKTEPNKTVTLRAEIRDR